MLHTIHPIKEAISIQETVLSAENIKMKMSGHILLVIAQIFFLALAQGTEVYPYPFMTKDVRRATMRQYDYIVVGGGTAGCPLAATLSTRYKVLLIERGGSPYGNPDIEVAANFAKPFGKTDNYTSIAQAFTSEDGVNLDRARVLGGGTALNAGFYSRASQSYIRQMGWDPNLVEQSYEWVEMRNAFRPRTLSTWSSALHQGLLESGVMPDNGYTVNHVEGTKVSASTFDNNGKRHTAADLLKSANAHNIVVLLHTTVSKIVFGRGKKPTATGVQVTDEQGRTYHAMLSSNSASEVILSAGSLGSTQLLMLSGVGPANHLAKFNIDTVVDNPWVGKGAQDHPATMMSVSSPMPLSFSSIQVVGILPGSQTYIESSSSASPGASGAMTYVGNIFEKVAFPLSRGDIRLKSTDPRDNPSVRYNYFADGRDLMTCVKGVMAMGKILQTTSIQRFSSTSSSAKVGGARRLQFSKPPPANMKDKLVVARFCKDTMFTMWHFHGGCHVGSVVNRRYQVIGMKGVRVVDGSTFRDGPGTNPQATTMMLGRYVGLNMLRERS